MNPMDLFDTFRAAGDTILDRVRWAKSIGLTFGGKRDLNTVLGYETEISTEQYVYRYQRGGLARRIINVYPNATWRGEVEVIEDENPKVITPFEQAWIDIDTKHQLQAKLQRVDKLSSLSTYAVLLIGAPGELETELPKGKGDGTGLLYFRPALGGGAQQGNRQRSMGMDATATIEEFETDITNERFGQVKFYQIKVGDGIPGVPGQKRVHWSRVIHVAEDCLEDDIFSAPGLESVWNLLDDLDKVTGGGAEAFWNRANQGMHIDIDKDMPLVDAVAEKAALAEQAEKYQHQQQRWIRTRGVGVTPLGSDVANFQGPADTIITQIAGTKGIPKRILTGSEMGELASSQDRENWRDQVVGRQKGFAGPYVMRPLIERLVTYNYMPMPKKGIREFEIRWPNIGVMTQDERMKGAASWATTTTSEGQVFTNAEIRETWYDKEPLTPAEQEKLKPAPVVNPMDPNAENTNEDGVFPRAASDHKFSSTQIQVPDVIAKKIYDYAASIPDEDLAEDGREDDAHITVKYGLHTESASDIDEALAEVSGPIAVEFGKTAIFKGPNFDVLYVAVKSADLIRLNRKIASTLETTDTHPTYIPHACVAYLKPGQGKKYVGDARFEGLTAIASSVVFSTSDNERTTHELALRAAGAAEEHDSELLRVLEDAILVGNQEVIDEILGLERVA